MKAEDAATTMTNEHTPTLTVDHDRRSHRNIEDGFDSDNEREEKSPLLGGDEEDDDDDDEDTLDHAVQTDQSESMQDDKGGIGRGNSGYIQKQHPLSQRDEDDEVQSFEDEESFDDFDFDASNSPYRNSMYERYMKKRRKKNDINHNGLVAVASESSITVNNPNYTITNTNSSKHIKGSKSYGSVSGLSHRNEDESLELNETRSNTYNDLTNDDNLTLISEDIQCGHHSNPAIKGFTE